MENLSPSDLKTILHSKRAHIYYLQHCRILVNGGRVEYVTEEGKNSLYWNIPIANTTSLLLGTGTSITQSAMRELGKAGVLVGFCGGGGTPLFAAQDAELAISWLLPQSEYRPNEYLQQWVRFWFDDNLRVAAAKEFQKVRIEQIEKNWLSPRLKREANFPINREQLNSLLSSARQNLDRCNKSDDILIQEAHLTKSLYRMICKTLQYENFARSKRGNGSDLANRFLDHGNYLAYGLAATATWVLGIPHGLAVLHGKTRRGGLVFDVADIVKDALILPLAFIAASADDDERGFRRACLESFQNAEALDVMIDTIKDTAAKLNKVVQ